MSRQTSMAENAKLRITQRFQTQLAGPPFRASSARRRRAVGERSGVGGGSHQNRESPVKHRFELGVTSPDRELSRMLLSRSSGDFCGGTGR